jgi:hypothetical protein
VKIIDLKHSVRRDLKTIWNILLAPGSGDVIWTAMKMEPAQGHIALEALAEAALRSGIETPGHE